MSWINQICTWIRSLLEPPRLSRGGSSLGPLDPSSSTTSTTLVPAVRAMTPVVDEEVLAPPVDTVREPDVDEEKRVIQSILSVFETGKPDGDYGACVVLKDGAGISYGKHQATDKGGSLDAIVLRYIDRGGSRAEDLRPYLTRLAGNETAAADPNNLPAWVKELMVLLRALGNDPVMRAAQDQIFDEAYWTPAVQQWTAMQLALPLSRCVVYDSTIHSGPNGVANIRKRFPEKPPSSGGDERAWTTAYLKARRAWLASNSNPVVQKTVTRIDVLLSLVSAGNWQLSTPIQIGAPYRVTIT